MMYYFNGSSHLAKTSFNNGVSLSDSYTISMWFSVAAVNTYGTMVNLGTNANPVGKVRLDVISSYKVYGSFVYISNRTCASNNCYTLNNIHHVFLRQSTGGIFQMYLDGVMAGTDTTFSTQSNPNTDFYLGSAIGSEYFTGGVSDVAVWNKPLNVNYCHQLLKGIPPTDICRDYLVDYFPLGTDGQCHTNGIKGTALTMYGSTSWIGLNKPRYVNKQRPYGAGTVYVPPVYVQPQYPLFLEDISIIS